MEFSGCRTSFSLSRPSLPLLDYLVVVEGLVLVLEREMVREQEHQQQG